MDICITFTRSKDFEQESVDSVTYTDASGNEITVNGEALLSHRFPIQADLGVLIVHSPEKTSNISWKDIRSISIFEPEEL